MKVRIITFSAVSILLAVAWSGCSRKQPSMQNAADITTAAGNQYNGFPNQVAWGKHLVLVGGCNDCHTPKKMTAMGPVPDTSRLLSGHPADMPLPDINRSDVEKKGLIVTNDLTAWVGPWGISYTANLTPDETGIGNWTEAQFIKAIRERKYQGLDGTRPLLPPMSFVAEEVGDMSDAELKAVFTYLKSIKPVHNLVPQPVPPVMAAAH